MGEVKLESKDVGKRVVYVGGKLFTVEYIVINYNFDSYHNVKHLSDLWDYITLPFYKIKRKLKDSYWEIRYGFQRMFKGYDFVDTFATCDKFIERYYKILSDYKKHHYGYPGFITEEEWEKIIDSMLNHLYYMDECNVDKVLEKDVPKNWIPKNTGEILDYHKDEFFKLFSEYFYHLWD